MDSFIGVEDDLNEEVEECDPPEDTMESGYTMKEGNPQQNKRAYHFYSRKPRDKEFLNSQEAKKKRQKHVTDEAIAKVLNEQCCSRKCCLYCKTDQVKDARSDFYGLGLAERTEYILNAFRGRPDSVTEKGDMIFDGSIVCPKAFWLIYGFSRGTYYNYKRDFESGVKVGYHGNVGTLRPARHTLVARAMLNCILLAAGEPMPHLPYSGMDGTSNICYKLPSCYTREEILKEVNFKLQSDCPGEKPISKSSFNKMWNRHFRNFSFHKKSAFAKCEECTTLKAKLQKERRKKERALLEQEREEHMNRQMSRRNLYYANRILAKARPEEYLCIIHDKMDQAKTGIPRKVDMIKKLQQGNCIPLPITLTGMLSHGRDPGCYAHFAVNGLWPSDPDFTITSLAKCLRDLETFSGDKSGDISFESTENTKPFMKALLDREGFKISSLEGTKKDLNYYRGMEQSTEATSTSEHIPIFNPLPKHLRLQMDNSGKDNKNMSVMAFCSELVARGVFETVEISFLMVGHTHEDIDAFFSRVHMRIRPRDIETLPELMAEIWECESIHPVSYLIQEVASYKAYIASFTDKVIGQSSPIAFRFSMLNNVPIYQVKESLNHPWTPMNGRTLWKFDKDTRRVLMPMGEPVAKRSVTMHKLAGEIRKYLQVYTE